MPVSVAAASSGTGAIAAVTGGLAMAIVITLLDDPAPFPESEEFVHVCRWFWTIGGEQVEASDRQLLVLVELSKIHEH